MAQGWLGFLEAMKPVMESVYGSAADTDNIIAQVRNDYANPNYHGYNLMYRSPGMLLMVVIVLLVESPRLSRGESLNTGIWYPY
jgi:hypothetical protein